MWEKMRNIQRNPKDKPLPRCIKEWKKGNETEGLGIKKGVDDVIEIDRSWILHK